MLLMEKEPQTNCGRWHLVREIGHGAYGTVYLGTLENRSNLFSNECVAVKVCRRDTVGDERYERELRGVKLYSAIPPQEGLVRMREFAEEPWGFYAVMDLADDEFGGDRTASSDYRPKTLAHVIEGEKALPLGECVKLGIALAKGLATLQRHHLLHRDIKPGNVIYVGGRPVLSDPGLVVEESEAASLVGTEGYDPPEGFTAAPSDVYSLGLTLKAASFGRSIEELDKGPAMEADTGAKHFPVWWRILNKATDPTSSHRYQSAKALLKDLVLLQKRVALVTKIGPWAKRVFFAAIAILAIAFVASAFFIGNVIYNARLNAFWNKASMSFGAAGNCWSLSNSLRHTKVTTSDTNVVALVNSAQEELSEIMTKSQEHADRFKELKRIAEEKYARGLSISKETKEAKKVIAEEEELKKRIAEIARLVYGGIWRPPSWGYQP